MWLLAAQIAQSQVKQTEISKMRIVVDVEEITPSATHTYPSQTYGAAARAGAQTSRSDSSTIFIISGWPLSISSGGMQCRHRAPSTPGHLLPGTLAQSRQPHRSHGCRTSTGKPEKCQTRLNACAVRLRIVARSAWVSGRNSGSLTTWPPRRRRRGSAAVGGRSATPGRRRDA